MTYEEFKQNFLPEFLNIRSFAGRIKYADQYLQRIGSGSGRIVYDIDGEKILKLAKNQKGIAQNEVEGGMMNDYYVQNLITKIFEVSDDESWLIAEKAKKINEKRIKELTGIPSLNDLFYFLRNEVDHNRGRRGSFGQSEEMVNFMWENEFATELIDFVNNYGHDPGDMGRPSTYGEVIRDGQPTIVLTDYGLSDEVYNTHYNSHRNVGRYAMYELYNYADGNDDILSDADGGNEIRTGMWALTPYDVADGQGVFNEGFINFVKGRNKYPNKPISNLPTLTDNFHECANNIKEVLNKVNDKKLFYNNLLELQNYLTEQGYYDRDPLMKEEYVINENDVPDVVWDTLNNETYANQLAQGIATKLGLPSPKLLGGGFNGFAYEIDKNTVMKITADTSEADAASKMMRGRPKYLSLIYNIYKVHDTATNKAYFVIMEENINDKPLDKFRKYENEINTIMPAGLGYGDFLSRIRMAKRFNYDEMAEIAKHVLTDTPEANISEIERKELYNFLIGMLNIRKELIELGIKSTDFVEINNLGYKNGVLKFFDAGGYRGVEPNIGDDNIITLPENKIISEEYNRDIADMVAKEVATKMGLPEPKFIGSGLNGVAYDIGNGKVLKITKDNSEATDNSKLIGKPLKYIAQPYNVFEIKSKSNSELPNTYAIILEKLKTDPSIQASMKRLKFAFEKIMGVGVPDVVEYYLGEWDDGKVSEEKVNRYLNKNPQDAKFFNGLLNIAKETKSLGVDSMDYLNSDNLGYKKNGVLGFFDMGFGNYFAYPENADKMEIAEDGTSLYSSPDAIGQDEFPVYNQNDTSPSINNDLDANISLYEDLIYNHVVGDATKDEFGISEDRKKDFVSGSKTVNVKKKCRLGGLGNTSIACNQGDVKNLEFGSVNETNVNLPVGDIQGGWGSYKIISDDGQVVGEMEIMNRNKYLVLDKIFINKEFRGQGFANDAMEALFEYADKYNKIITLTPDNLWGSNKNKLQKWYQSLGFVMNKGRNKDFETMQLMYRPPKNLPQEYEMMRDNKKISNTNEDILNNINEARSLI